MNDLRAMAEKLGLGDKLGSIMDQLGELGYEVTEKQIANLLEEQTLLGAFHVGQKIMDFHEEVLVHAVEYAGIHAPCAHQIGSQYSHEITEEVVRTGVEYLRAVTKLSRLLTVDMPKDLGDLITAVHNPVPGNVPDIGGKADRDAAGPGPVGEDGADYSSSDGISEDTPQPKDDLRDGMTADGHAPADKPVGYAGDPVDAPAPESGDTTSD